MGGSRLRCRLKFWNSFLFFWGSNLNHISGQVFKGLFFRNDPKQIHAFKKFCLKITSKFAMKKEDIYRNKTSVTTCFHSIVRIQIFCSLAPQKWFKIQNVWVETGVYWSFSPFNDNLKQYQGCYTGYTTFQKLVIMLGIDKNQWTPQEKNPLIQSVHLDTTAV